MYDLYQVLEDIRISSKETFVFFVVEDALFFQRPEMDEDFMSIKVPHVSDERGLKDALLDLIFKTTRGVYEGN